jgi:Fe-S cluster assembly iron-binding protein IscA
MCLPLVVQAVSLSGSVQHGAIRMGVVAGVCSGWRYDTLVVVDVKTKDACAFAFARSQAYHATVVMG